MLRLRAENTRQRWLHCKQISDASLATTGTLCKKRPRFPRRLPFDRKIRLGCRKHNGNRFTSTPQNCHIRYGLNPKHGRICVAWVWNRQGTEKLVNGKQHFVWFVPTGMNGLPQNVLFNFRLDFRKSDLTIYLLTVISESFCQMVSTHYFYFDSDVLRCKRNVKKAVVFSFVKFWMRDSTSESIHTWLIN